MSTIPALKSLRGTHMTFTGRLAHMTRAEATRRARRRGAVVAARVTSYTQVVVQGAPSPTYKWGDIGVKLAEVDALRKESGQLVYVISQEEFEQLLAGAPLSAPVSRTAATGATDPLGVPFRPRRPRPVAGSPHRYVDLDAVDRALAAHEGTLAKLARVVRQSGFEPLTAASPDLAFDLAWHRGRTVHVAEVKSLTESNEAQQLRLGLGQVLDYRERLRRQRAGRPVRGHLVVPHRPAARHFEAVCRSADVTLVWPAVFSRLMR